MIKDESHEPLPEENAASPEQGEGSGEKNSTEALAQAHQELLYLRADFENTKKRILREQEQAIRFANERLISEMLSVVDLFELALGSSAALREKNDKDVNNYLMGIEMTHRQLIQTLEKMGVEMIGKTGETFDPARHEAVSQIPVQQHEQIGTILQVANRGCLLHGRLLKPARVVVGEGSAAN
jgi:molecular chaperone GrpE